MVKENKAIQYTHQQKKARLGSEQILCHKGTTSNDLGVGPEEIEKKIISEALLREKNFHTEGVPGKK